MHAKPKPRPGSLPLPKGDAPTESERDARLLASDLPKWIKQQLRHGPLPPWQGGDPDQFEADLLRREVEANFTALQKARAMAEELAGAARNAAFDDWVCRCVGTAKTPDEWTQARVLYENYIAHAQRFGRTREQRMLSVQGLATETQWGRMMATLATQVAKKRRASGWYYSLKCKRAPAARLK